ncbi:hypothetical protein GWO43_04115 [candidate division KSB1 bacterium]|nr:hypothetical protein [candidate division KSB1 bacterium]NIT70084.1 hypothetical protein [candidate division KSB1 bacterium]NIX69765.1 hypothetical protein [candidate division KSB1 bacterium]
MFIIRKMFKNDLTLILKIEGAITERNFVIWSNEISYLIKRADRQIILEFCEVTSLIPKAVNILIELITNDMYLLNCPIFAKNMLHSAGLAKNVLD